MAQTSLDVENDKKGGRPVTHEKSLEKVKYIKDSLDLVDIWRMLNPDTRHFTCTRSCPERKCRLGIKKTGVPSLFLIMTTKLPPNASQIEYKRSYQSL